MKSTDRVVVSRSNTGSNSRGLRITILSTISLLIVQFVIGIMVNLFAVFPPTNPGNSPENALVGGIVQTGPGLGVHAVNGLIILALSGAILYYSIRTRASGIVILAVLGIVSVLLGLIGGVSFVLSGFQNNLDSFLMALGFIFAISSYFVEWNFSSRSAFTIDRER